MLYYLDCFGLAIFALIGVLQFKEKGTGWVGGLLYALLTALGGGTLRDCMLGQFPVFWMRHSQSLWLTLGAAVLALLYVHYSRSPKLDKLWLLDTLGLAVFIVSGTQVALAAQVSLSMSVLMGLVTAMGGGLLRDALGSRQPFIFKEQSYVVAACFGGLVYAAASLRLNGQLAEVTAIVATLAIRWGSRAWSQHRDFRDRRQPLERQSRQALYQNVISR